MKWIRRGKKIVPPPPPRDFDPIYKLDRSRELAKRSLKMFTSPGVLKGDPDGVVIVSGMHPDIGAIYYSDGDGVKMKLINPQKFRDDLEIRKVVDRLGIDAD